MKSSFIALCRLSVHLTLIVFLVACNQSDIGTGPEVDNQNEQNNDTGSGDDSGNGSDSGGNGVEIILNIRGRTGYRYDVPFNTVEEIESDTEFFNEVWPTNVVNPRRLEVAQGERRDILSYSSEYARPNEDGVFVPWTYEGPEDVIVAIKSSFSEDGFAFARFQSDNPEPGIVYVVEVTDWFAGLVTGTFAIRYTNVTDDSDRDLISRIIMDSGPVSEELTKTADSPECIREMVGEVAAEDIVFYTRMTDLALTEDFMIASRSKNDIVDRFNATIAVYPSTARNCEQENVVNLIEFDMAAYKQRTGQ